MQIIKNPPQPYGPIEAEFADLFLLHQQGKLPMKRTPLVRRYIAKYGHVGCIIVTDTGTIYECDDYVRQSSPQELERRRKNVQHMAGILLRDQMARKAIGKDTNDI